MSNFTKSSLNRQSRDLSKPGTAPYLIFYPSVILACITLLYSASASSQESPFLGKTVKAGFHQIINVHRDGRWQLASSINGSELIYITTTKKLMLFLGHQGNTGNSYKVGGVYSDGLDGNFSYTLSGDYLYSKTTIPNRHSSEPIVITIAYRAVGATCDITTSVDYPPFATETKIQKFYCKIIDGLSPTRVDH